MSLHSYTPEFKKKIVDIHEKIDEHIKVLLTSMVCQKPVYQSGVVNLTKNIKEIFRLWKTMI